MLLLDRLAAGCPRADSAEQVVKLGYAGFGELVAGGHAANARAAMDKIRFRFVEFSDPLGEIRSVHVDEQRTWDMSLGILPCGAHVENDGVGLFGQFLKSVSVN